ncbi:hypothetical protein CDAR_590521 [Caerostris darwini]|uniref:Uncharacterized protein n=1 Tax=Caerostris darwini TaxID=1538125 RepID=A0AAV4TNH9_9ARAC|nr:hypothetical protein CDAR_590521 [Caerostris darwini]
MKFLNIVNNSPVAQSVTFHSKNIPPSQSFPLRRLKYRDVPKSPHITFEDKVEGEREKKKLKVVPFPVRVSAARALCQKSALRTWVVELLSGINGVCRWHGNGKNTGSNGYLYSRRT